MADSVYIGENSPEQVAYKLMFGIAQAEGKKINAGHVIEKREWVLKAYYDCLMAVQGVEPS